MLSIRLASLVVFSILQYSHRLVTKLLFLYSIKHSGVQRNTILSCRDGAQTSRPACAPRVPPAAPYLDLDQLRFAADDAAALEAAQLGGLFGFLRRRRLDRRDSGGLRGSHRLFGEDAQLRLALLKLLLRTGSSRFSGTKINNKLNRKDFTWKVKTHGREQKFLMEASDMARWYEGTVFLLHKSQFTRVPDDRNIQLQEVEEETLVMQSGGKGVT